MKLQIVGSTYLEICDFPEWREVFGSGLRAACIASRLGSDVEFHSVSGANEEVAIQAKARGFKFRVGSHAAVPRTILFSYIHGFSTPSIWPAPEEYASWEVPTIQVNGEAVLRFGFLEVDAVVRASRAVYDPQNPYSPRSFRENGSHADHLAIVCNQAEGRRLTGEVEAEKIVRSLADKEQAEVVVLKSGSRGACVFARGEVGWVPAFKTKKVWPIGSGDVFAASFAHYWAAEQNSPLEAARMASLQTSHYCETKSLEAAGTTDAIEREIVVPKDRTRKVYLAGPFFSMAQIWLINEARHALMDQGFSVFSPLHDVGKGPAEMIYPEDIKGIVDADVVYAVVDGLDAGTIFEIGYAKALGKPVVVFVQNEKAEDLKMLEGSKCLIEDDFVTSIYKTSWCAPCE